MSAHFPTIKQLQYLVALRQHAHFGRAAEACFVTQSTLSAGLRELETSLGVTLVERTRRVVGFTALGERIADKAVCVLREAEELADLARAEGRPLHGELRMGVIPTIAPFLLPAMLPRVREQWPSLKLYLREEPSQAACEALHRGQLDCVLLALPYACGNIDSAPLFDDRLYVAFPRGEAPGGSIAYRFQARDVNLVLAPPASGAPVRFAVKLDGLPPGDAHGLDVDESGEGTVSQPRMYQLVRRRGGAAQRGFEITFLDPGVRAYVFTFG